MRKFSRYKKWHTYPERPVAEKPGILVQIDTVWDGPSSDRLYLYTLLDVCSRWGFAWPAERADTFRSIAFLERVRKQIPFAIQTLQSDHGSEFGRRFTQRVEYRGMSHRHSRVRTPTDNAHLERFNRTIQDQCLNRLPRSIYAWRRAIPEYLHYYNTERPHMGLNMRTPMEVITSY